MNRISESVSENPACQFINKHDANFDKGSTPTLLGDDNLYPYLQRIDGSIITRPRPQSTSNAQSFLVQKRNNFKTQGQLHQSGISSSRPISAVTSPSGKQLSLRVLGKADSTRRQGLNILEKEVLIEEIKQQKQEGKLNSRENHHLKICITALEKDIKRKDEVIRQLINQTTKVMIASEAQIEVGGVKIPSNDVKSGEKAKLRLQVRSLQAELIGVREELANFQRNFKLKQV